MFTKFSLYVNKKINNTTFKEATTSIFAFFKETRLIVFVTCEIRFSTVSGPLSSGRPPKHWWQHSICFCHSGSLCALASGQSLDIWGEAIILMYFISLQSRKGTLNTLLAIVPSPSTISQCIPGGFLRILWEINATNKMENPEEMQKDYEGGIEHAQTKMLNIFFLGLCFCLTLRWMV